MDLSCARCSKCSKCSKSRLCLGDCKLAHPADLAASGLPVLSTTANTLFFSFLFLSFASLYKSSFAPLCTQHALLFLFFVFHFQKGGGGIRSLPVSSSPTNSFRTQPCSLNDLLGLSVSAALSLFGLHPGGTPGSGLHPFLPSLSGCPSIAGSSCCGRRGLLRAASVPTA